MNLLEFRRYLDLAEERRIRLRAWFEALRRRIFDYDDVPAEVRYLFVSWVSSSSFRASLKYRIFCHDVPAEVWDIFRILDRLLCEYENFLSLADAEISKNV